MTVISKQPHALVALFGPQRTQWTSESLSALQTTLQAEHEFSFIREALISLPSLEATTNGTFSHSETSNELQWICDFAKGAKNLDSRRFNNTSLAPLTVASQAVDFILKTRSLSEDGSPTVFRACQGFCIGFLSAASVASSTSWEDYRLNISNSVRLAACIGMIVDQEEATKKTQERFTAISVRWKSSSDRAYLEMCLDSFPDAYITCVTDERVVTIAIPDHLTSAFRGILEKSNISTMSIELTGRYHHPKHVQASEVLSQICYQYSDLQLPSATQLRRSIRATADGSVISTGDLHDWAIQLILCKRAHWFQTVKQTVDELSEENEAKLVSVGAEPCIPRSLSRSKQSDSKDDTPGNDSLREEIAVVGMACRFPEADNLHEFWQLLNSGGSAIGTMPATRFDPDEISREPRLDRFWGNFIKRPDVFDHRFFDISGREAKSMDPQQRLALQVAYEALESSGYCSASSTDREANIGCYLGVGAVDYEDNIASESANAFSATGTLRAFISGRISHFFGWSGPSLTLDTACSSSAVAIHTACRAILGGECSMALAGGVNVITSPNLHQNLAGASFLNSKGASRAFDDDAGGYCRGEGAGMVVLKPLAKAIEAGDEILGVISGTAVNQGGNYSSITVPDSNAQSALYKKALQVGGIEPTDVTYVEAHGTGTQICDPIEYESVRRALTGSSRDKTLYLGSVKDNIGHAEAASGVAGVVKTLLMMHHNTIPKQANFKTLNHKVEALPSDKIIVPSATQPWGDDRQIALVNNYGASGNNAVILLRRYHLPDSVPVLVNQQSSIPITLAAKTASQLQLYIDELRSYLLSTSDRIEDVAWSVARRQNTAFEHRAAFLLDSEDSGSTLHSVATQRVDRRPVVLTFGGQTGLTCVVSKDLYDQSELFGYHLDKCDAVCRTLGLPSIVPRIFQGGDVEDLVHLHCMLLALQVSTANSWIDSGAEIETLLGHSFGQIAALCVAGSISLRDAFRYISGRAHLVQQKWGADPGSMLSVECTRSEIDNTLQALTANGLRLGVACYNGPSSCVLSGETESIEKAGEILSEQFKARHLQNSHAYHSYLADGIMEELEKLAQTIDIKPPRIAVETCTDGSSWSEFTARNLSRHTRDPVFFSDAVERIASRSPSAIWLEAGSSSPAIPMVRRILRDTQRSDVFVPVSLGGAEAILNLSKAACQLWQGGSSAQYWLFHKLSRSRFRNTHVPPYQFERIPHWIELKPRGGTLVKEDTSLSGRAANQPNLVSLIPDQSSATKKTFAINTFHHSFQLASRGHAVASKPLCPASMYVELAAACAMTDESNHTKLPYVEELTMSSPLGLASTQSVYLKLQKADEDSWKFRIYGTSSQEICSNDQVVEFATGSITLVHADDGMSCMRLKVLQKFVKSSKVDRLANDPSATGISGQFVYRIFSDVVEYANYYRGVRTLTALDNEAIGIVSLPAERSQDLDSAACDPVSLDNFLQVAGIHVNCLSPRKNGEVFMCTSINEVILTPEYMKDRSNSREWVVHTQYESPSEVLRSNDILVCDRHSGNLVVAILGATFRSVSLKSLMRTLGKIDGTVRVSRSSGETSPVRSGAQDSGYHSRSSSPISTGSQKELHTRTQFLETADHAQSTQKTASVDAGNMLRTVREILSEIIEIPIQDVQPNSTLDDLGVDSLLVTEVLTEIKKRCQVEITQEEFLNCTTVQLIAERIQPSTTILSEISVRRESVIDEPVSAPLHSKEDRGTALDLSEQSSDGDNIAINSHESFLETKDLYTKYANETNFSGFCTEVYPKQAQLVTQYVVDAFKSLGCDLGRLSADRKIPSLKYDEKHTQVIQQLHNILEDAGLIKTSSRGGFYRTEAPVPTYSTSLLHEQMLKVFPKHSSETKLLRTTANKLAECLSGAADPIALLFGDATARALLSDVYASAPMFKTGTLVLGDYISSLVKKLGSKREIRILELGAGTGGTTMHIVKTLAALGTENRVSYTFTDLSSSLVMAAKRKFSKWDFMEYKVMDIEKEPDANLVGTYDIVISTNCIHATRDLVRSTTHIRKLLRHDGILCLIELTRNLFWFDLVFGLLEGWWLSSDGRNHALASEIQWDKSLRSAGFSWVDWTDDSTAESDIVRLIVASPYDVSGNSTTHHESANGPIKRRETVTYKTVDGVELLADIHYPKTAVEPGRSLPVALMIHGGGHVMLSRKDVRPEQTALLLEQGLLPISVDYRLCPEVTLQEGPMTDVADALGWVRTNLSQTKLSRDDIRVDAERVVAVGWSTGGHLAMTLAWTSLPRQIRPPEAILAFYCPSDYEDPFWSRPNIPDHSRTITTTTYELDDEIWSGISDNPITSYNVPSSKSALGGWLAPSDPRSRLALYMNYQGRTLPVLLNGLDKNEKKSPSKPTGDQIRSVSPLAQIRQGTYKTPTFIIHPRQDDLIPWQQAERTYGALVAAGVEANFQVVEEGPHLFDISQGYQDNIQAREAVLRGYQFLFEHVGLF